MKYKSIVTISYLIMLVLLAACGSTGTVNTNRNSGEEIHLSYAENLTLTKFPDYLKAEITNPWDTTKILHTYLLITDSVSIPENLPSGTVVRIPLKNSVIFSSVHNSLISEIGALDAIAGVCDASYIYQKELQKKIKNGEVADCGNSTSPNLEKIIKLTPDAVLLSPFENSGNYGKLGQLGIPIIECADYMETSPLGRAEWMKFYGLLYGEEAAAAQLFEEIENEYLDLKQMTETIGVKPKVLVDRLYGSSWDVPAKYSTMGVFIEDAGGINPFSYIDKQGSSPLAGEQVLMKAGDADIWLIRYSQTTEKTLKELEEDNGLYKQFKAFKNSQVFGCNTSNTLYFEEVPFHPQRLLRELVSIFHPEINMTDQHDRYFKKME